MIPRWFQVGFLGVLAIVVIFLVILHPVLKSTLDDLSTTSTTDIVQLQVHSTNGKIQELPTDLWGELRIAISSSKPIAYTGLRGESFTRYCSVVIRKDGDFLAYTLELRTRPSMKGSIELELQRGSPGTHWSYGSYSGNTLLDFVKMAYPEHCSASTA